MLQRTGLALALAWSFGATPSLAQPAGDAVRAAPEEREELRADQAFVGAGVALPFG